jgi:hypothetical protein
MRRVQIRSPELFIKADGLSGIPDNIDVITPVWPISPIYPASGVSLVWRRFCSRSISGPCAMDVGFQSEGVGVSSVCDIDNIEKHILSDTSYDGCLL